MAKQSSKEFISKAFIRGFVFVGNPINVNCRLPFNISDHLKLKRPNNIQLNKIQKYLDWLGGACDNCGPFERKYIKKVEKEPDGIPIFIYDTTPLPEKEWRYYIVEFKDCKPNFEQGCYEIRDLRAVSKLTQFPMRLDPVFTLEARLSNFTSDWEYFTDIAVTGGDVYTLELKHLEELKYYYSTLIKLRDTHPDIVRSILMYHEIPDRQGYNELTTLGLFSVLESLLTHSPMGEYDSIGQQIRKKIALLQKRLIQPLEYSCFDSASHDAIWNKLYDYRPRIAHGGEVRFDKKLSVLRDPYNIELFLRNAVRILLGGALGEPDLYSDLRAV